MAVGAGIAAGAAEPLPCGVEKPGPGEVHNDGTGTGRDQGGERPLCHLLSILDLETVLGLDVNQPSWRIDRLKVYPGT